MHYKFVTIPTKNEIKNRSVFRIQLFRSAMAETFGQCEKPKATNFLQLIALGLGIILL